MNRSSEVAERLQGQRFVCVWVCDATTLQLASPQSLSCFGAVLIEFERDALLLRSSLRYRNPRLSELVNSPAQQGPTVSACSREEAKWLMRSVGQNWCTLPVKDFRVVRVLTPGRELHIGIAGAKSLWITYCPDFDASWMFGRRTAAHYPTVIELDTPNTAFGWVLPASPHPMHWDGRSWQNLADAWAVSSKRVPESQHEALFGELFNAKLMQYPNLLRRFAMLPYPVCSRAQPWVAEQIETARLSYRTPH